MSAYVRGDTQALRILYSRYSNLIVRIASKRGLGQADAFDVSQQAFLQLHRARHDFTGGRLLRPWLLTIARNETISALRRRKRTDPWLESHADAQIDATPGADEQLWKNDEMTRLKHHLDVLSEALRAVIELHFFEELSFADVAAVLGISEGAAKVRAHRAYALLREKWVNEDENPQSLRSAP